MIQPSKNLLLLRQVRIIAPDRVIEQASCLIAGGNIARILDSNVKTLPAADSVLDLQGLTLFPGFIDRSFPTNFKQTRLSA
jgi:dihydroorotase-like cyclic amidohydrolase